MTSEDQNSPSPSSAGRRGLLVGAAVAAAAAGAGLAWWRSGGDAAKPTAAGPEAALWSQSFETPAGTPLALQSLRGKPLLVNFWATWCPPCIEELPLLDAFFQENKANSFQVLGLAIDQPSAVKRFLEKMPLSFPVALAGLGGTELGKSLGNLTGALPFTVVLGASGAVLHRKMGKVSPEELAAWRLLK
jgi:thiol-disulfide isomerase/thioredoxin